MSGFEVGFDAMTMRDALSAAVCKRGTMDVAEHVLLDASDGETVKVTSTDLVITRATLLQGTVGVAGRVTAHAELMRRALNGLSGSVGLRLSDDASTLTLGQGRRRFTIPHMPADVFPVADSMEGRGFDLDGELWRQAIDAVAYCMAKLDTRIYLNGITIEERHIVAADGHRLAVFPADTGLPVEQVIIPRDSVDGIMSVLGDGTGARLFFAAGTERPSAIEFYTATDSVRTTLIDSCFRQWPQAIQIRDDGMYRVRVACDELRPAIERVAAFTKPVEKARGIALASVDDVLEMSSTGIDATDQVSARTLDGIGINLGMESRYILDVTKKASGKHITIRGTSPIEVHEFSIEGRDDKHYIMPMRL